MGLVQQTENTNSNHMVVVQQREGKTYIREKRGSTTGHRLRNTKERAGGQ
jgi:hypothetical protein